jgi:hypothetical protein
MFGAIADDLEQTIDQAALRLRTSSDAEASVRPRTGAWSAKEILGHLVDSAANNHQRFVRAQEGGELVLPGYQQDHWVSAQGYQYRAWLDVVDLWTTYNRHLAHVVRRIPERHRDVACRIAANEPVALQALVADYVAHLRHHLAQIDERLGGTASG